MQDSSTQYRNWVHDEHGNPVRPAGEPDPNTVRMVVAAVMGVIALIMIGLAINAWSNSQGLAAAILGLSSHYLVLALFFGACACSAGIISTMSALAAVRAKQGK
jgi:predicted branched-subunit amino acid permease